MPQRRGYYGGGRQQPRDFNEFFTIGRMIRDQITGEEDRQRKMAQEFEGIELEEAQLRLRELQGKKKHQELQDQLLALEMSRRGDIARIGAMEGTPATLRSTLGGQRQAQLQGAGGAPNIPMNLPIPNVEFQRHPMQQVRGIQMPEAGIDVAGYETRPRSLQEVILAAAQRKEDERVDVSGLPGLPEGLESVDPEAMSFLSTYYRQQETAKREKAEQLYETGKIGRGQVYETGKIGRGQVFKAGEAQKGRVSQAEQKRLDREAEAEQKRLGRESTERVAGMRRAPKTEEEKLLDEANRMRKADGLPLLTELPQRPQPGIPPVARAEEAPELHIEAPNGRNFTAVMAQRYKEKAGGDLQRAIDMAIEDGWRLPAGFQTGK